MRGADLINVALPEELLEDVLRHVGTGKRDLDVCALVCRHWHRLERATRRSAKLPASGARANEVVRLVTEWFPALVDRDVDTAAAAGLASRSRRHWGNSLCQGATLPLPVPLKVDKVEGGVRLGFIGIDDGVTELLAYIDCLVSPATDGSGLVFRAIRNGRMKDMEPPGEPRIMRSLLQALQKSIQIAQI